MTTTHLTVQGMLHIHGAPCPPNDIASLTRIPLTTVYTDLHRLADWGFAYQLTDPTDPHPPWQCACGIH